MIFHKGANRLIYSSFIADKDEAIEYAKSMPGVIAVKKAHTKESPVWIRDGNERFFE